MDFLTHIERCNQFSRSEANPFYVAGRQIGWVKHKHKQLLSAFPDCFVINNLRIALHPSLSTYESRTLALSEITSALRAQKHLPAWRGETYDIAPTYGEEPFFALDRGATAFFGVPSYGTHLNGYTYKEGQLYVWIAKRASHLAFSPNKLDNLAAGGLPRNITPFDNMIKEAGEEAQLTPDFMKNAIPTGFVSYLMDTPRGITPDMMFIFDIELPVDMTPRTDGEEIEEFLCLPVQEVYDLVKETDHFKHNSALVMIDFLIRHQIIPSTDSNYQRLKEGLHVSFQL